LDIDTVTFIAYNMRTQIYPVLGLLTIDNRYKIQSVAHKVCKHPTTAA